MTNPNALAVPTRTIQLIRHGATRLNNDDVSVDRIRGWKDIPLSPDGKKEAERIGREIAKNPPDFIASSDLERAYDTAKAIADACDMAVGDVTKGFRPWNLGDFEGNQAMKPGDLVECVNLAPLPECRNCNLHKLKEIT